MTRPFTRQEAAILSPLRYPGAKRRLAGYLTEVLRLNTLRPKLFVEPFAGGASVALQLLKNDLVDAIALGDRDPMISSFWKVVFDDSEWLINQIETIGVTVNKWRFFRKNSFRSRRELALSCLFLNRTSFSGILSPTSGPIGGYSQTSEYKIDCRFPVETIVKRIRQATALRKKVIFVETADWLETIAKVKKLRYAPNEVFYYLDPPFYEKADRLYKFYFQEDDHTALHNALVKLNQPWLLSYDPAKPILTMYSHNGRGPRHIDLLYSVSSKRSLVEAQELIITNQSRLPKETRLWRSSQEWRTPLAGATHQRQDSNGTEGRHMPTRR
jgi:DNA adenine methylase